MKKNVAVAICLLLWCCGPSADEEKMARDVTTEVVDLVNSLQSSLQKIDDAADQISAAIIHAESFRMKYQKDSTALANTARRLKSEKERLLSFKSNMGDWVRKYRAPDFNKTNFNEALSTLKKDREQLVSTGNEIQNVMEAAQAALDEYNSTVFVMAGRKKMKKDVGSMK